MKILFIKKKLEDGSFCDKCADIEKRAKDDDIYKLFETLVIPTNDEAIQYARDYSIRYAPFFIVVDDEGVESVCDSYYKLKRLVNKK